MEDKCCGCGKPFANGDRVVSFQMQRVKRGERSNSLGYYKASVSKDNIGIIQGSDIMENTDHVHFTPSCLERTFSPIENPFMYDVLADQVRQRIYEEESDYDYRDIIPEIPELLDNPPQCLWCKRTDTVWVHFDRGYPVFNCLLCKKLWDHEEDELSWDNDKQDYFLVR